jgi:hypothetical protein
VEASTAVRQAEVTAAKTMLDRVDERFDLYPERLAADSAYGSAEILGWLVHELEFADLVDLNGRKHFSVNRQSHHGHDNARHQR